MPRSSAWGPTLWGSSTSSTRSPPSGWPWWGWPWWWRPTPSWGASSPPPPPGALLPPPPPHVRRSRPPDLFLHLRLRRFGRPPGAGAGDPVARGPPGHAHEDLLRGPGGGPAPVPGGLGAGAIQLRARPGGHPGERRSGAVSGLQRPPL